MIKSNIKLVTGRLIEQGVLLEDKMSEAYRDVVAVCEMNGKDMNEYNVKSNVRVKSEFGEVVVKAKRNDENPPSMVFIPMGPWANAVIGPNTGGCGMPQFKGIDVEVKATKDKVLIVEDLMKTYMGGVD